jgi:RNA polymerase sigma-70 factor (ECF subfamily)
MGEVTAELWQAYHDRVRRFIRVRVRNGADADDLAQEVFAKIHAGAERVEDPAKLEAWVFQIARRAVIDHFRKRRLAELPGDVAEEPAEGTAGTELASCLPFMMEGLSAEDREALTRVDLEGLPQTELADRLGLPLPSAKSRVQRARRRLKEALLACCSIETDRRGIPMEYAKNC